MNNRFIPERLTKPVQKIVPKYVTYRVHVITSDIRNAGTDANVFVQIYGPSSDTGRMHLKTSLTNKNPFECGATDVFEFKAQDVGDVRKIRVGHDNSKIAAGWHLHKILIQNVDSEKGWLFVCDRWFDKNEDDGQIERDLYPQDDMARPSSTSSSTKPPLTLLRKPKIPIKEPNDKLDSSIKSMTSSRSGTPRLTLYRVYVFTSNVRNAGTDANVFIQIHGAKVDTGKIPLKNSLTNKNPFERDATDVFEIKAPDVGDIIKIRIGHDNSKIACGWHLDKVIIQMDDVEKEWLFQCYRWFDKNEDDGQVERDLYPQDDKNKPGLVKSPKSPRTASNETIDKSVSKRPVSSMKVSTKAITYKVFVTTSDVRNAGTDANVFIQMYGPHAETEKIPLKRSLTNKNPFERGATDMFEFQALDLEDIRKIRIGHDNSKIAAGWHMKEVVIEALEKHKKWVFPCGRWFDKSEEDHQIERELFPYEPESKDEEEEEDKRLSLRSNQRKPDRTALYNIYVATSNIDSATTDANVFVQLYSDSAKTEKIPLIRSKNNKQPFQKGQVDFFELNTIELDDIERIKIGHDGKGKKHNKWHLNSVKIEEPETGRYWMFPCELWFDKKSGDTKIERDLYPIRSNENKIRPRPRSTIERESTDKPRQLLQRQQKVEYTKYLIHVHTSNIPYANTNAQVFIQLFGTNSVQTDEILLERSKTNKVPFKRGNVDTFQTEDVNISDLKAFRIGHYGSKNFSGWHLRAVIIEMPDVKKKWTFMCKKWLVSDQKDGKVFMELDNKVNDTKGQNEEPKDETVVYNVAVTTSDVRNAGTDANVYVQLFSDKYSTDKIHLKNSKTNKNPFERGKTDIFEVETSYIGPIKRIRIGHDNSKMASGWHLKCVEIQDPNSQQILLFPCSLWLDKKEDDGQIERELYAVDKEEQEKESFNKKANKMLVYEALIKTSDVRNAGTDANVHMQLFGSRMDSDVIPMVKSKSHANKFERGKTDHITFKLPYLGDLHKIRIGHDNKGIAAGWHLESVTIQIPEINKSWLFKCNKWLDKNEGDGRVERDLVADGLEDEHVEVNSKQYIVDVYTGKINLAGTDANVYLTLYGTKGHTVEKKLSKSQYHTNKFERSNVDRFIVYDDSLGAIEKIRVRHDNSGLFPSWFLHKVDVFDYKNQKFTFLCDKWLAEDKEEGDIDVEFIEESLRNKPSAKSDRKQLKPVKKREVLKEKKRYYVKIRTGNKPDSSDAIDSNVYLTVIGDEGISKEIKLLKSNMHEKKFQKDQIDLFVIDTHDLGMLYAVKVRHDMSGRHNDWFLNSIEINDERLNYVFNCQQWLSPNLDDQTVERTLIEANASMQFKYDNIIV